MLALTRLLRGERISSRELLEATAFYFLTPYEPFMERHILHAIDSAEAKPTREMMDEVRAKNVQLCLGSDSAMKTFTGFSVPEFQTFFERFRACFVVPVLRRANLGSQPEPRENCLMYLAFLRGAPTYRELSLRWGVPAQSLHDRFRAFTRRLMACEDFRGLIRWPSEEEKVDI